MYKFHFTPGSAKASHVAWEHLDYDHTANAFLLDCAFTHRGKHPQVVELLLPRVTGFTEYYNHTRLSHLVDGVLVWNKVLHTFLEELTLLLEHLVERVHEVELDPYPSHDP